MNEPNADQRALARAAEELGDLLRKAARDHDLGAVPRETWGPHRRAGRRGRAPRHDPGGTRGGLKLTYFSLVLFSSKCYVSFKFSTNEEFNAFNSPVCFTDNYYITNHYISFFRTKF